MKNVPLSNKNWRMLRKVRDEQGFKHYNKTLEWMIAQVFSPEKTTITLEPEIFYRLVEIKADNHYATISETIGRIIGELLDYQEKDGQECH